VSAAPQDLKVLDCAVAAALLAKESLIGRREANQICSRASWPSAALAALKRIEGRHPY
jgi:hypothetical protein